MTNRRTEFIEALHALAPQGSFIVDDILLALNDEDVRTFYIRPETIFDADSVYERIVIFLVTAKRLVLLYTDTSYEMSPLGELVTTIQGIDLNSIKEYQLIKRRDLDGEHAGGLNSVVLRLRWGSSFSQDLQPAACEDPACTNDHGYVGVVSNEDFQLVVEERHDGTYFPHGVDFIMALVKILGQR
ncbi:DUF5998 family protein [Arcanobacterium pinnipediorum]|uniref:DUF5998 family protein n=1 Tax=Arcanobacterium pinnipediorum TaxID=1503041 RepID=A0ABY5AJH8_9ACTO|nr:DUF5998 family protein [Arcanobacterium pinnipediorum]USR80121.1 DUF5998 family protein [Arcanobacterium pinnipediorum]